MPGGDRTGPQGMGSKTGRAMGFCAGNNTPGFTNPIGGRGMAMRRGRGGGRGQLGRRYGNERLNNPDVPMTDPFPPVVSQTQYDDIPYDERTELENLRKLTESLESSVVELKQQIEKLEATDTDKKAE